MKKHEAAIKILYILSSIDGDVSFDELEFVREYMAKVKDELDFDFNSIVKQLFKINKAEGKKLFTDCAISFLENSTETERLELLEFAAKLLAADGRFSIEEVRMINILAEKWSIDIDKFMNSIFQFKK